MRQRQQRQESLAKLLSYILCRRPDEFGLVLDDAGRLPVKELLWALVQEEGWGYVRRSHLGDDHTAPGDQHRHTDVHRVTDLRPLLPFLQTCVNAPY